MDIFKLAEDCGFSHWAALDRATMVFREQIRHICQTNGCHRYNEAWDCPPVIGSLEECEERVQKYSKGVLLQSTATLEDEFDIETMIEAAKLNGERTAKFAAALRKDYPDALIFNGGGCRFCEKCSFPDSPCRFPEKLFPSLEGYGIVVTDLCKANNLPYYYGPLTLTYTSAALYI
jgi:predicted metal-binding protein